MIAIQVSQRNSFLCSAAATQKLSVHCLTVLRLYCTGTARYLQLEAKHDQVAVLILQEQDMVSLVTLAAAAVLLIVGSINLFQLVQPQTLW